MWPLILPWLLFSFICFIAVTEITSSSDIPSGKPVASWGFDICVLWPKTGFGEDNGITAGVSTWNDPRIAVFWLFWGPSLLFSATGCHDTNFLRSSWWCPPTAGLWQGALQHSQRLVVSSSPPPLCFHGSNLCPCAPTWPQSPMVTRSTKGTWEGVFWAKDFPLAGFRKAHVLLSALVLLQPASAASTVLASPGSPCPG